MYYKLATVAADWWCKQIQNRYRIFHFDEIDTSFAEKICLFKQSLTSEIHEQLKIYHYFTIGCCFFPDKTLAQIANETGLNQRYLPIHAHLEITNNSILVSSDHEDLYKLNVNV